MSPYEIPIVNVEALADDEGFLGFSFFIAYNSNEVFY